MSEFRSILPVNAPAPDTDRVDPLKVKFASPCIAFAPVTVQTVLFVDPDNDVPADIPVKLAPDPTKLVAVTTPAVPILILLPTSNCPPVSVNPAL